MTQLRFFVITDTIKTFQQEVTAYQNVRDWVKKQRDETIKCANKRANDSQAEVSAVNSSFDSIFSFASEVSLNESYTIEPLSQKSWTLLNEDFNTAANSQKSEISMNELRLNYRLSVKHFSKDSKQSHQSQQKQHNADKSSGTEHSYWFIIIFNTQSSSVKSLVEEKPAAVWSHKL